MMEIITENTVEISEYIARDQEDNGVIISRTLAPARALAIAMATTDSNLHTKIVVTINWTLPLGVMLSK